LRWRVKVQTIICDRLALLLRVRSQNVAPETGADVVQPKFRYINGLHGENGSDHLPAVENNDVSVTEYMDNGVSLTSHVLLNIRDFMGTRYLPSSSPASTAEGSASGPRISSVERLLASMNDQLESRLHADADLRHQADKDQQLMKEWMIAAAVVDRICFIVFSFIFIIGTAVLFILATAIEH